MGKSSEAKLYIYEIKVVGELVPISLSRAHNVVRSSLLDLFIDLLALKLHLLSL